MSKGRPSPMELLALHTGALDPTDINTFLPSRDNAKAGKGDRPIEHRNRASRMMACCAAVAAGAATNREAAALAGVTPQTLNGWIRRGAMGGQPYANFLQCFMSALQTSKLQHVQQIRGAADRGDWKAAESLLTRLDRIEASKDFIQEAHADLSHAERIAAAASHPEVIEAVLAAQKRELAAKAKETGHDSDG